MSAQLPPWSAVEAELATRPKLDVVRLAVRGAARLAPVIVEASGEYGPEAVEWALATDAVVKLVEATVARFAPTAIYTHSGGDLNVDHVVLHRAVLTATRPMAGGPVKGLVPEVVKQKLREKLDPAYKLRDARVAEGPRKRKKNK